MQHRRRRRWHCCGASWRSAACCRRCPTIPSTWAHGSRENLSAHARPAAAAAPAARQCTPRPRRQSCSREAFWNSIGTGKMGGPRVHMACWHACVSARGAAQAACFCAHCGAFGMLLRCCRRAVEDAAASSETFWASSIRAEWAAAESQMAQVDNIGGSVQGLRDLWERCPASTDIQTIDDSFTSHLQPRICA